MTGASLPRASGLDGFGRLNHVESVQAFFDGGFVGSVGLSSQAFV
jgi:hypothetical protein